MSDDPFADLPGDADRTVIRPRPGGRGRAPSPSAAPDSPPDAIPRGLDDRLPLIGLNPLLRAAAPLLAAIQRLRGQAHHPNPDALRRALTEGVREFEQRALQTGLDSRSLRAARYALCATIDDLVLSTPWGSHSAWTTQSLTSLFHNEVSGGERFFDILDQMEREIGKHGDVVELMFVCLCLGFEGRYRVLPRGSASLPSCATTSSAASASGGRITSASCRRTGAASARPMTACATGSRSGSSLSAPSLWRC